jgi:hypothetical protein
MRETNAGNWKFSDTALDAFRSNVTASVGIEIHRLIIRWSQVRILAGPPLHAQAPLVAG